MTTNFIVLNNRNLFSHSSGDQNPEIKLSTGLVPCGRFERLFRAPLSSSGDGWQPEPVLGLWMLRSSLPPPSDDLRSLGLLCPCVSNLPFFYTDTDIGFKSRMVSSGDP